MNIDIWKVLTAVLSVVFVVSIVTPSVTGLFSYASTSSEVVKVELFIMSYCPYGTQAQEGIIPAIQVLGGNVDFSVKFVDYIMHGKQEIDENLRQYCIQEVSPSKYLGYATCFVASKDASACMASNGIDASSVASCVASTDDEFDITNLYNDKSTWLSGYYPLFPIHADLNDAYGVQGSPTLVVNGKQVSSASRSAQGFLDAICASFTAKPGACAVALSGSAATSTGSCN
ncbi:MAG TPA: hypothetical protein VI790_05730 [Candidatus Nanoarchaeia archaeon]|nr:hypothetical protein [Candidatus Nanoarchaeia archaeon]